MSNDLPIIKINRYILRKLEISDYLDVYEYGSDSLTTRFLSWGPYVDITDAYESVKFILNNRDIKGYCCVYAIVDSKINKMIGSIDFHTYDPYFNSGEIGYVLSRDYWNRGIITEAVKKIISLGFELLNFDKIIIGHTDVNFQSKRVIEKCDFHYDYTLYGKGLDKYNNEIRNIIYYSIDKIDYERGILKWQ